MGHNGGNILKWATVPPLFAFITVSAVRFLGNPELAVPVDPSIWAMTLLLFIIMSTLYVLFIMRGVGMELIGLQALAQGVLLCPMALSSGAYMIQWIGVLLAASGASALVSFYHQSQPDAGAAAAPAQANEELHLPVPYAITDENGVILNVSTAMLKIAGFPRDSVIGQSITVLLDPGEHSVELGGKTWSVTQEPMEDDRYYFQLGDVSAALAENSGAESDDGKNGEDGDSEAGAQTAFSGSSALIDPATQLYTPDYAMTRLEEELYRTKRYGHPMTAALLRMAFPDDTEKDGTAQAAFNAYCGLLSKGIRASDTAGLHSKRSILLVFSECAKGAGELALQRLLSYVNELYQDYPVFYDITALHVSLSFESTDALPSAGGVLQRLETVMEQKYSLQLGA